MRNVTPKPSSLLWLVLLGGAARASDARILSRHRTRKAAVAARVEAMARLDRAVGVERDSVGRPDVYVTDIEMHEASLRGSEAVQALCGQPRRVPE